MMGLRIDLGIWHSGLRGVPGLLGIGKVIL
jgi:hypothetical protein